MARPNRSACGALSGRYVDCVRRFIGRTLDIPVGANGRRRREYVDQRRRAGRNRDHCTRWRAQVALECRGSYHRDAPPIENRRYCDDPNPFRQQLDIEQRFFV